MEHITRAKYIYLGSDISDHSSTNFAIDVEKQEKGTGIFRANPSLLKHQNYITLIHNVIYNEVLEAVDQNVSQIYNDAKNNFLEMITIQEEILKVEMLHCETDWPINDRLADLNSFLMNVK